MTEMHDIPGLKVEENGQIWRFIPLDESNVDPIRSARLKEAADAGNVIARRELERREKMKARWLSVRIQKGDTRGPEKEGAK